MMLSKQNVVDAPGIRSLVGSMMDEGAFFLLSPVKLFFPVLPFAHLLLRLAARRGKIHSRCKFTSCLPKQATGHMEASQISVLTAEETLQYAVVVPLLLALFVPSSCRAWFLRVAACEPHGIPHLWYHCREVHR